MARCCRAELRDPVLRYALTGDAPLLREVGIDPAERHRRARALRAASPPPRRTCHACSRTTAMNPFERERLDRRAIQPLPLHLRRHICSSISRNLIPWGAEMYSNRGVLPDASAVPLTSLFPNVLAVYDRAVVCDGAAASRPCRSRRCSRSAGATAFAAVALWYLWACFFGRNPLTANPGLPYVGLMLLAHALIPPAPYGSLAARGRTDPGGGWFMPQSVWAVVWILMAVGYTYSGVMKLSSPSWLDGSALRHVLENPLARPTPIREMLLALPPIVLRTMTWAGLALEIGFAPLRAVPPASPVGLARRIDDAPVA